MARNAFSMIVFITSIPNFIIVMSQVINNYAKKKKNAELTRLEAFYRSNPGAVIYVYVGRFRR